MHKTNCSSQAKRNPEEEGDYMAFEQLMHESMAKKAKDQKKKDGKKAKHEEPPQEATPSS